MSGPLSTALREMRLVGRHRAEAELERLGFSRAAAGWRGTLRKGSSEADITIRLPEAFPDCLPEVVLSEPGQYSAYAHVERTGKLCLASQTGTYIDDSRPEQVIQDSLERAAAVLFPDAQAHQSALREEFVSYWADGDATALWSICSAPVPTGPIWVSRVHGVDWRIAAPDNATAESWAARTGRRLGSSTPGFAAPLAQLFDPPRFADPLSLHDVSALLESHGDPATSRQFSDWLSTAGLPAYLLMSAPHPSGLDVEFAALIRGPSGREGDRWQHGFRPGRAPRPRQVAYAGWTPVARLGVSRLDPRFLTERGGGTPALLERTVVVVGCGAVGSHASTLIAATGVGHLRLIDPDLLSPENVHRHALGMSGVGQPKVNALQTHLQQRFPHLEVRAEARNVLEVIDQQSQSMTDGVDLVLVAVGDETIERRLNRLLPRELKRVHVWLEPFGLGGHVAACGLPLPGCYECLFRADETHGLINMSSLAEPGQVFQRTLAGCGGTFTPFGAMDAVRAASEAATAVTNLLLDRTTRPNLHSWLTSSESFLAAGHRLSDVGRSLLAGASRRVEGFEAAGCAVCKRS